MTEEKTLILTNDEINQKIKRIAYEIYENNFDEKEIILAGIASRGYVMAERLTEELNKISPIKINLVRLRIDKKNPMENGATLTLEPEELKDKVIIIVDDVVKSGKTLIYASKFFLGVHLKKLRTVALVDREHRRYPISVDFVGMHLSTSLQEHVSVEFSKKNSRVYLT
ncbi:MAG: phosphoribosyltransferase [Flavobacteriales bacterium]|nr:phosphoribosyltransferase [Flavobacteriales bacterium]